MTRAVILLVALSPLLVAQGDLWKSGAWSVQAPAGTCGSLPLLQVKGPGTVFDPPNASTLTALEKALPVALAKVCPGVREVILSSGRTRRLVKLADAPAVAAAPTAISTPPPAPAPAPRDPEPAPVQSRRIVEAAPAPVAAPTPAPASSAPPALSRSSAPVLTPSGNLKSLASARDIEDKCEVLFQWLETSKLQDPSTPNTGYRYLQPNQMLTVFRDEPMIAVFGMPYDKTENRWRLDTHEKVLAHCMGTAPPARATPFSRGGPNRTLQQYAQQFQQYRPVLDQAFLGTAGFYEPTAVTRFAQHARAQVQWANNAMASAAGASSTREAFDQSAQQQQQVNGQMAMLSPAERTQVTAYLARRQSELAPTIVEDWFRQSSDSPKTVASAKTLVNGHSQIAPALNALDAASKAAAEDRYRRLVESLIADSVQKEVTALKALPSTLVGVQQLAVWKSGFDNAFGSLRAFPLVATAGDEYTQARTRIVNGALPVWVKQAEAIPADGVAITAKRRELDTLFPSREDRGTAYAQYEAPLRAKEEQLRAKVEADRRQQQAPVVGARAGGATQTGSAAAGGPAPAGGALTATSFSTSGLSFESVLRSLFTGEFADIRFDRDDLKFAEMYTQYLRAYGSRCATFLPRNKVEIMTQECATERVTTNGYGMEVSRTCVSWVPVGTGIYADPDMYNGQLKLEALQAGDALRTAGRMLMQKDPLAGAMSMVGDITAIQGDMQSLVVMNACNNPGLKRFEENLKRFALNQQPVRLNGQVSRSSAVDPLPGIPFRDQNYGKLLEDLVSDHATTWVMNRYQSGSLTGAVVSSRDSLGRPAQIWASYTYQGYNGRMKGDVRLAFTDGVPECMYFSDFPNTCRTPNRRIVAKYAEGGYQE